MFKILLEENPKMKKNLFTVLSMLAIFALVLTACATPTTEAPKPTAVPPTAAPAATAVPKPTEAPNPTEAPKPVGIKGEVTLWHAYSTGSAEESTLAKIVDAVKKKNPDLKLNVLQVPFDKIFDKYKTEVASGAGPDMFVAPNDDLGNLARGKLILDITKQLDGKLGDFAPNSVDGMKVDGKIYGVPESAKAVALYYNKSLVDKAPTTTDELLAAVKGGKSLNLFIGAYHDFGFFGSFGGKLLDDNQKCVLDTTGGADAMQYLLDLKKAGAVLEADYGKFETPFRQGKVAMMVNGPWALGDYKKDLGDKLGVVSMPTGPKGKAGPLNGIDGFYVNPNVKNVDIVVATAMELVSKESSQMYTDGAGHVPIRKDVTSADPLVAAFAKASADGFPRPQSKEFGNYWEPFGNMFTKVLEGKATPADGVKEACGLMNKANGK
jgi:arabinogalactan oligomer/maltooligosaccharide transport system substrate-binding protein